MAAGDEKFFYCIILALIFSPIFSLLHSRYRRIFSIVVQLCILYWLCSSNIVYLFSFYILSYATIKFMQHSSYLGITTFIFSFSYLGILRLYFPWVKLIEMPVELENCFLISVLKIVSLAYSLSTPEAAQRKEVSVPGDGASKSGPAPVSSGISFNRYCSYIFFVPGSWSGPVLDWQEVEKTFTRSKGLKLAQIWKFFLFRTLTCSPYLILYFWGSTWDPVNIFRNLEYDKFSLWTRIAGAWSLTAFCRSRYISCWWASETICLLAGVDSAAEDSDVLDASAVKNYDPMYIDTGVSLKDVTRSWNCSVQTWLVNFVYKRVPLNDRNMRKIFVMLVSALWHGWSFGYFASFFLLSVSQIFQEMLWKEKYIFFKSSMTRWIEILIKWLVTQLLLTFCTLPFVYAASFDFIEIWRRLNYYGFILLPLIFGLSLLHSAFKVKK